MLTFTARGGTGMWLKVDFINNTKPIYFLAYMTSWANQICLVFVNLKSIVCVYFCRASHKTYLYANNFLIKV